ncbi:MAG: heavy metal translocating P-type ATPase metal-binding domain-containing protein [Ignavibacteriales bacterium]|nr:MAG: heavy metal translocating P-type ATPase metal-binding domain-containing protein [Ignavibacteriales bacterium]
MALTENIALKQICYHCGDDCPDSSIFSEDKYFCCNGCKTVYEILNEKNLCNYYSIQASPGITAQTIALQRFEYLDDEKVSSKIIEFADDTHSSVTFSIPQMHCSSCIWLLENLNKLDDGIHYSRVDFLKKTVSLLFYNERISLSRVVHLLASLGYEPELNLDTHHSKEDYNSKKKVYLKLGIAAFCFGNIMLLSFPEYLSIDVTETFYKKLFNYLNLFLSLPVFFYSSSDYFISAIQGLRKKIINIDVPLSLGILVLFVRSVYEVLTATGPGYFDSFTGLIFFLLIGKLFQQKTYDTLNFERDYKAYFPLAVNVKKNHVEKSTAVADLEIGDRIIIRKDEIIPADSVLISGVANIDYSFVTGESSSVHKNSGDLIYAGGKQIGSVLELEVIHEVSQSYLTRLWNNDIFKREKQTTFTSFSNKVSKYFTAAILLIATAGFVFWYPYSSNTAFDVFTAVLIVACPCALALSIPFTLGNVMRILGRNKMYLKNTAAIEEMAGVDSIVFDKTGTLTETGKTKVEYIGEPLNDFQKKLIKSVVRNSTHPLSRRIYHAVDVEELFDVTDFLEIPGTGLQAMVLGINVKVGSIKSSSLEQSNGTYKNVISGNPASNIFITIDEKTIGYFSVANFYREDVEKLMQNLSEKHELYLLSGDNESEKENLMKIFHDEKNLLFRQSPQDKLDFIKALQAKNKKVLMAGDGLNDAGALTQSNVGIAVTENISNFTPACDAILDAAKVSKLGNFLEYMRSGIKIIYLNFGISILYNLVGLSFAIQGNLSPLIAAILMPLSSISVVAVATFSTNLIARRRGLLSL